MWFVVDKAALGRFSPSTSVFTPTHSTDCPYNHRHHVSSWVGTVGQIVADVLSRLCATQPQEKKNGRNVKSNIMLNRPEIVGIQHRRCIIKLLPPTICLTLLHIIARSGNHAVEFLVWIKIGLVCWCSIRVMVAWFFSCFRSPHVHSSGDMVRVTWIPIHIPPELEFICVRLWRWIKSVLHKHWSWWLFLWVITVPLAITLIMAWFGWVIIEVQQTLQWG
jgi:hypothetical protein